MLSEILTSERHRVVAVGSGREALERMAMEHYDVILTDMRMPDLDGRALYRQIEQRWPDRAGRVVFVTGDTLASALREFVSTSGRRPSAQGQPSASSRAEKKIRRRIRNAHLPSGLTLSAALRGSLAANRVEALNARGLREDTIP